MVNFPGFIGPAYQSKAWKASAQRAVNLYFEGDPEKGGVLFGTPGTTLLATLSGNQIILAELETPSCLVVTSSSQVNTYSGVAAGSLVAGSVVAAPISISQYVSIAQAGSLVMLVNGANGYSFDRTNPLSQPTLIVSAGFRANPQYCTALNGRFIVNWPDTDEFSWSDPFAVTFDPLEFASAEMLNDKLVRPVVLERELYLIGQTSTEVWAGVSTIDVFAPIQGTFIPYGTIAPETAATIGRSLLWLSRDANGQGIVIRVQGLQSQRVSTHAIEEEMTTYSTITDAYAWTYQQQGHEFYVLTFPTAQKTWCLDLTLAAQIGSDKSWHERASTVPVPGTTTPITKTQEHHIGRCHAYFQGLNVIGSRVDDGKIYSLDPNVYTEATGTNFEVVTTRTSPHVFANGDYNSLNRVQFGLQPGVGLPNPTDASDAAPQALMRISKDGGRTWGPQRSTTIGAQGNYKTRIGFNRCGRARDFVVELTISARVFKAITSAQLKASP